MQDKQPKMLKWQTQYYRLNEDGTYGSAHAGFHPTTIARSPQQFTFGDSIEEIELKLHQKHWDENNHRDNHEDFQVDLKCPKCNLEFTSGYSIEHEEEMCYDDRGAAILKGKTEFVCRCTHVIEAEFKLNVEITIK